MNYLWNVKTTSCILVLIVVGLGTQMCVYIPIYLCISILILSLCVCMSVYRIRRDDICIYRCIHTLHIEMSVTSTPVELKFLAFLFSGEPARVTSCSTTSLGHPVVTCKFMPPRGNLWFLFHPPWHPPFPDTCPDTSAGDFVISVTGNRILLDHSFPCLVMCQVLLTWFSRSTDL